MKEEEVRNIIFTQLKKIAPETEPEKLGPKDNIRRTLDIDSFDFLQFIVAIDKQLELEIPESDYGKIDTIEKLLSYIFTQIKQKQK